MNELYCNAIEVKSLYKTGKISREEAITKLQPYVDYYNAKCKELAKKYHQKAKPFSFAAFMR